MNRPYNFVAPAQFPRPDGSIPADAVAVPGITTLTSRLLPTLLGAQVGDAEFIEAIYAPTEQDLADLEGEDHEVCGWVRHRLHLPPRDGRPVVLLLYGPCYEIAEEGGDLRYRWAPLPEGFDADLGLYVDLDALLVEMLGHHSVADCERRTLVPARVVEIIRDCLDAWHRDAMRLGAARPRQIAVSRVRLPGEAGARHAALHVVAGAPESGRVWTLAVLDGALDAEDLAACLAEELVNLPEPQAVERILTPQDASTGAVVCEALAMTRASVAGFKAAIVAGSCRGERDPFLEDVAVLDLRLEGLAREAPLTLEQLEKRALVRQGFAAARPRARVLKPIGGGQTAPSWIDAAE